jgi:hypothetical protein
MQLAHQGEQLGAGVRGEGLVEEDDGHGVAAVMGGAHQGEGVLAGRLASHPEVHAERTGELCLDAVQLLRVAVDGQQQRPRTWKGRDHDPRLGIRPQTRTRDQPHN